MKPCIVCAEVKPLSEFYKHPSMADGHLNKCKECHKAAITKNREANIERYRAYDVERFKKDPERKAQGRRNVIKFRTENPEKYTAQTAVGNAIRDGRLRRKPCEVCGGNAQAHHDDYSKPLEVRWLCPEHHAAHHKEQRRASS